MAFSTEAKPVKGPEKSNPKNHQYVPPSTYLKFVTQNPDPLDIHDDSPRLEKKPEVAAVKIKTRKISKAPVSKKNGKKRKNRSFTVTPAIPANSHLTHYNSKTKKGGTSLGQPLDDDQHKTAIRIQTNLNTNQRITCIINSRDRDSSPQLSVSTYQPERQNGERMKSKKTTKVFRNFIQEKLAQMFNDMRLIHSRANKKVIPTIVDNEDIFHKTERKLKLDEDVRLKKSTRSYQCLDQPLRHVRDDHKVKIDLFNAQVRIMNKRRLKLRD